MTSRGSVPVAIFAFLSTATGCAHAVADPAARAPQTTAATIDVRARAPATATATATNEPNRANEDAEAASGADDEFDEMPLFKRPTTWRELLELVAARAEASGPQEH